jgi:energy-coupling factor transporter ATP-binding protein EcfA2
MHPLFGQDALFQTIRESYSNLPHLFITGPPGCGKTTFLEQCIQMFKTEAPFHVESVLYLSSEKDRGIHTIRDKINDYCKRGHAKPNSLRFIVIDDADALRRPMETFAHLTRFLFASRSISHMIEPLRSRCCSIEMEPISPVDAFPRFVELYNIPDLQTDSEVFDLCVRNFTSLHDMKCILKLYGAHISDGKKPEDALSMLRDLIPSSTIYINKLVSALYNKNYTDIRTNLTSLYLNGYVLDDILLAIEKAISIFPSTNPENRYSILQFVMFGWISIQQGREHWMDAVDILDSCGGIEE